MYNPIEVLKVRAQVNRTEFVRYRTAVPLIIQNEGFGALYKGLTALMLRDAPAWGVYFWAYQWL